MTTFKVNYSGGIVKLYRDTNSNYKIVPVNDGASPTPTNTTTPTPTLTTTPTPTPSRSVTSSNFITLAYTAGSWSGTGTSASKLITDFKPSKDRNAMVLALV